MTQNIIHTEFSALILAGGLSRRMGEDKSQLITPKGINLLQHSRNLMLKAGASQILVSSNSEPECIEDNFKYAGPLAGIEAGLAKVETRYVVILPVDMPLLTLTLIHDLLAYAFANQRACCYQNECLPLVLTEPETAQKHAQTLLQSKQKSSIWRFCEIINSKEIEVSEPQSARRNSFKNANDPQQWLACQKLMK